MLSQPNPTQAAETIVAHDYNHIIGNEHDEYDPGMVMVKKVAEGKKPASSNRFVNVILEEGSYDSMEEFLKEDAQANYFGFRPFWGSMLQPDSPMGKVCRICDEAAQKWVDSIKEGKVLPPAMSSDVFEPEKQLMVDILEEVTREIYPELGIQAPDDIFGRRQVVYMLNWTFQKAKDLFPEQEEFLKTKELALQTDKVLPSKNVKTNEQEDVSRTGEGVTINPSYIANTAKKILKTLTGENKAQRASFMMEPCTIGMIIKAEPGKDLDTVFKENLANEWGIISRKVDPKIAIKRGVKVGNVTYVICVDDGTDKSLETFANNLKKAGNSKERTFAWVLANKNREENNKCMQVLNETAHVVGLNGEYLPVSWQMLAGRLFVDYVDSINRSDNTEEFQERINALVERIINSVSMMN